MDEDINTSFSKHVPGLQFAIDSTSLGEYKTCPRKYKLAIVDGWEPKHQSVHLTFGLLLHEARGVYDKSIARGESHLEALRLALKWGLCQTWNTRLQRGWISDHNLKNRQTFIRTLVWYLDRFENDPLQTVILKNGHPAIELSFRFGLGFSASTGEEYYLCGHLDRLVTLNEDPYVSDLKTTGNTMGPGFFMGFSPDNQFSTYSVAGRVVFETPIKGIIVDGAQIAVGFSRFERQIIPRSESQLSEWLTDLQWWMQAMERSALQNHWPQNDKACHHYGGCPFRQVCCRPPGASRERLLVADYKRRVWDPLKARGDV